VYLLCTSLNIVNPLAHPGVHMTPVTRLCFVFSFVFCPFFYFSHFVPVRPPSHILYVLNIFEIIREEAVNAPDLLRCAHLTWLMFTLIAR
jgi:hypothetical protein